MDKKDKIILQQLDVIRSMTENNMKRMNSDFWGTPFENVTGSAPKSPAPTGSSSNGGSAPAPEKKTPLTATAKPGDEKPAEEELPPEKIEDLLAELDSYIGLGVVKEEVHNLINMVQVYKLRQQHDLPTTDMSLHMVFTGNPGTGKTMRPGGRLRGSDGPQDPEGHREGHGRRAVCGRGLRPQRPQ